MRTNWMWVMAILAVGCAHDYKMWTPQESSRDLVHSLASLDARLSPADDVVGAIQMAAAYHEDDDAILDRVYRELDISAGKTAEQNRSSLKALFGKEHGHIRGVDRSPTIGLALSGGGVRSASFSQGVLMGLHEAEILKHVGYLSTVSGGGYTGGWYMTHGLENDNTIDEMLSPGSTHLHHLAQSGQWLMDTHWSRGMGFAIKSAFLMIAGIIQNAAANGVLDFDVNTIGPRTIYNSGLCRAFLYKSPLSDTGESPWAHRAMGALIPTKDVFPRPFWIVNCHLVLRDALGLRNRSGDHFEITPLRAGARTIGYVQTNQETDGSAQHDWMSPVLAMAASGAAVDQRSLKQGPLVNMIIRSANLDLGQHIRSWSASFDSTGEAVATTAWWAINLPFFVNWISGWVLEFFGGGTYHDETVLARKYYITDGGHFDNTGIYSLVQRGCRLIIAADASWDPVPSSDWETLTNAQRALAFEDVRQLSKLLYADFGAELDVEWSRFTPELTPDECSRFGTGPRNSMLIATIDNLPVGTGNQGDRVVIVFIKAAYSQDRALRTDHVFMDATKATSSFPNNSTGDQFYTEQQVLSYRSLGQEITELNRNVLRALVRDALDGYWSSDPRNPKYADWADLEADFTLAPYNDPLE